MTKINQEVIYNILEEEVADKLCRFLAGYEVSFTKSFIKQKDIISDYNDLKRHSSKKDIIEILSKKYELSISRIYGIVANED